MTNTKKRNKFYYSTYSNDIYSEAHQAKDDVASRERLEDGKHIKDDKRHWLIELLLNVRLIIVVASIVVSSVFFSNYANNEPTTERYKISRIVAPPSVFEIKSLQIPAIGNVVNKRKIFRAFIDNVKSDRLAERFSGSNELHKKLYFKKGIKFGETQDSVKISLEVKKLGIANQWLSGFLVFAAEQTINEYIKKVNHKVDDRKDKIKIEIDDLYAEQKLGNQDSEHKIERFKEASKIAKEKGITNSVDVESIPEKDRFGDLLYLQGYWKLDAEVKRLDLYIKKQSVDISSQQKELRSLEKLYPKVKSIQAFYLEKDSKIENLNSDDNRQTVWSVIGAGIGLIFGLIVSYPFRRKKVT